MGREILKNLQEKSDDILKNFPANLRNSTEILEKTIRFQT